MVGFGRAKNERSSHRQGVRVGTRKKGFLRSSKRRDFGKSKLFGKEVRDSSYLGLLSIFGSEKEGFSVKGLFGKEKWDFRVFLNVASPRRTLVRLGEGENLHTEDWCYA